MGESEEEYIDRLCYYGCLSVFDDYYEQLDENYSYTLAIGSRRNLEFAKKCMELDTLTSDGYMEPYGVLLSKNIVLNLQADLNISPYPKAWFEFNYPKPELCIKFKDIEPLCLDFLGVLYDNKELLNDTLSDVAYSLALNQGKTQYIKDERDIDDTYFIRHLNIILDGSYLDREQMRDNGIYDTYENDDYENIHTGIYSDNEVFINYDKAISNYNNNIKSNIVLSKLFASNTTYINLLKTENFFLMYTRNNFEDYDIRRTSEYCNNYLIIYNILYIKILSSIVEDLYKPYNVKHILIPEYSIFELALKYNKKDVIDKIMELYHINGNKFIKILDMKNQKYVYEEISEIPERKIFNPLIGDEFNNIYS